MAWFLLETLALGGGIETAFLLPDDAVVAEGVRRVSQGLAREKLLRTKEELNSQATARALELLFESWDLSPTGDAAGLLGKLGYKLHRGAWRTEEEVKAFEEDEEEREAEAREKLELPVKKFRNVRTDHFRLFTDMPTGPRWDRWLEPVLKVLEGTLKRYQEMFPGLVSRGELERGLNIVFFQDRKACEEHLREQGVVFSFETAGAYFPHLRSSFFYRERNHAQVWRPLLHEITHQLNEELFHAARAPWLNEGLAVYLEAALVGLGEAELGREYRRFVRGMELSGSKR